MSLVAAMVMGASAFAIDNVKVNGDAKVYYSTSDDNGANLFDKAESEADTALRLGVTGDLLKGVSFGVTGYAVSSLGLENNLVNNVWSGAHGTTNNSSGLGLQVNDEAWIGEAWLATTVGKTTAKVGRMELDTPLVFSEKWNIAPNTFEGAVLINQDIQDTTLVGAWIGKGNGGSSAVGFGGVVNSGATFNSFVNEGAYAAAIINNSFKPLVAQAWYYNVSNVADAFWLQADWDCQLLKDVKIGVQYANLDPKGILGTAAKDSSAYAVQVAYEGIQNLKLSTAYSDVDNDGILNVANVATGTASQSKLYTEAAWGGSNYGYVSAPGAESWNLKASYDVKDLVKVCASYTNVENDKMASNKNLDEIALSVSKSFGPLDTKLAYISTTADDQNVGSQFNTLNAYLTLNF
ncbi:MAG TPA: OprD family outer membrane porin [Sulfuricurvum sp.]|nr:OprD family outer membrane porin [Sulfuricurvum sp.]